MPGVRAVSTVPVQAVPAGSVNWVGRGSRPYNRSVKNGRRMAIQFSCKCGHKFSVADDEAGGLAQCPRCGLLNDIPLRQDLASITEDGTYKLDAAPVLNDPEVAAELIYVYTRGAHDIHGDEKDMRLSDEEMEDARGLMIPLAPDQDQRVGAPKYDPDTGELINDFDVAAHDQAGPHPSQIPMATPVLTYAAGTARHGPSLATAFVHLFTAPNMAVMFAIFCMHAFLWPVQFVVQQGIFFLAAAVPAMFIVIVAHYGNVIEDVGPHEKDDLPRPMRDLEWYDDIWMPFCSVFGAMIIAYLPAIVLAGGLVRGVPHPLVQAVVVAALVGVGTFAFPAILLTLQAGGTALNLRPDRVLKTISKCGAGYFYVTVIGILAFATYFWGFAGTTAAMAMLMDRNNPVKWYVRWPVVAPMLAAGIVLMHYFCVCLGMLYRVHHAEFPWILQRHVSSKPRVVAPPRRPRRKPTETYEDARARQRRQAPR